MYFIFFKSHIYILPYFFLSTLFLQGVISRLHCPLVNGHRVSLKLTDGATVTYDLYHAIEAHPGSGDFTLCVCPGIGNNSESVYIRSVECKYQFARTGATTNVVASKWSQLRPLLYLYVVCCPYTFHLSLCQKIFQLHLQKNITFKTN